MKVSEELHKIILDRLERRPEFAGPCQPAGVYIPESKVSEQSSSTFRAHKIVYEAFPSQKNVMAGEMLNGRDFDDTAISARCTNDCGTTVDGPLSTL